MKRVKLLMSTVHDIHFVRVTVFFLFVCYRDIVQLLVPAVEQEEVERAKAILAISAVPRCTRKFA